MKRLCVKNGIDNISTVKEILKGKRIGLITNHTGVNKELVSTIDILNGISDIRYLFAPEHGVRGDAQAGEIIESSVDTKTGIKIHSLYGVSHNIPDDILNELDVVVFDIQDVGARYYTYIYTLSYAMEDCARAGKKMIVLDRINPIGAVKVEGTVLNKDFASFVGRYPIAARHGLTVGEFAGFINKTQNINCDLMVVKATGWKRDAFFDQTDLIWISPSPNLPTVDSCFCYAGTCLFEGTNVSEGRGTANPFEVIGSPWLNSEKTVQKFNLLNLPGVVLRKTTFVPTFSKYSEERCNAVQLCITDKKSFKPFETALRLLLIIKEEHSEFRFNPPDKNGTYFFDRLLGTDALRHNDFNIETFLSQEQEKLNEYKKLITPFMIYK